MNLKKLNSLDKFKNNEKIPAYMSDIILSGIGETVSKFRCIFNSEPIIVNIGDGVNFEIAEQDPTQRWRDRLSVIIESLSLLNNYEFDLKDVLIYILKKDGWSWTSITFRTPVWMNDFCELSLNDAISDFNELECIAQYI